MVVGRKTQLLNMLESYAQMYQDKGDSDGTRRYNAYMNVYRQIKGIAHVSTMADISQLVGVGKDMGRQIAGVFGGRSASPELREWRVGKKDRSAVIRMLTKFPGISPKKAHEMYSVHHIRDVAALKRNAADLLSGSQRTGLKYMTDILKPIPSKEVDAHKRYIRNLLYKLNKDARFWIMGSYRRRLDKVGDIDVIVTGHGNVLKDMLNFMQKNGYILHVFSSKNGKVSAACRLPHRRTIRKIDITHTTEERLPFALLYYTGPIEFNVTMRNIAKVKGMRLNERGLFDYKTWRRIDMSFPDERSIFDFLGIEYLEPSLRSSRNIRLL